MPNVELSRSRRGLSADETGEQRIFHRDRKQKGRRLSAPAQSWAATSSYAANSKSGAPERSTSSSLRSHEFSLKN